MCQKELVCAKLMRFDPASIFRCHLTVRQMERFRWELDTILTEEDRLLIRSLCEPCERRVAARNQTESWFDEAKSFEIAQWSASNTLHLRGFSSAFGFSKASTLVISKSKVDEKNRSATRTYYCDHAFDTNLHLRLR